MGAQFKERPPDQGFHRSKRTTGSFCYFLMGASLKKGVFEQLGLFIFEMSDCQTNQIAIFSPLDGINTCVRTGDAGLGLGFAGGTIKRSRNRCPLAQAINQPGPENHDRPCKGRGLAGIERGRLAPKQGHSLLQSIFRFVLVLEHSHGEGIQGSGKPVVEPGKSFTVSRSHFEEKVFV